MNRNLTILITILLFSCEREITIDTVNVEQELVMLSDHCRLRNSRKVANLKT
jgi:hypothetical protein